MEKFLLLLELYPALKIALIIAAVALIISLIGKLFKLAIVVALVSTLVIVVSTICLGDGTAYVNGVAQFLPDEYRQKVEEGYQDYREMEAEDPIVDYDKVKDAVKDSFDKISEAAGEAAKDGANTVIDAAIDHAQDKVREQIDGAGKGLTVPDIHIQDPEPLPES